MQIISVFALTVSMAVLPGHTKFIFESAKAGAHWGRHNGKNQYGRQTLSDFVIIP